MATTQKQHNAWNSPLMYVGLAMYAALLSLFGWQTWQFVNWLFPDDQLLAKILTMLSFDILAAFWAVVHTFYRFASRGAKTWVIIAWGLTFILSLLASILYLVIQFYFRFSISVSPAMVDIGYAVSIVALVFNILALMSWLILEHQKRHPRRDEFEQYEQDEQEEHAPAQAPASQPALPPAQPAPATQQKLSEQTFTYEQMQELLTQAHEKGFARGQSADFPSGMEQWFNLYKQSGETGTMSFHAWLERMKSATQGMQSPPQTDPFAQPPLNTAGQTGASNGHQN